MPETTASTTGWANPEMESGVGMPLGKSWGSPRVSFSTGNIPAVSQDFPSQGHISECLGGKHLTELAPLGRENLSAGLAGPKVQASSSLWQTEPPCRQLLHSRSHRIWPQALA